MSRPTAKPLQRTPRAPLLAPAPEPNTAAKDAPEDAPEAVEDVGRTQQLDRAPQEQPEAAPPALQEAGAGEQEKFLSVRVPKDLHRRIRVASLEHDLPIRQIVLSAVTAWLDEHDKR